MKKVLSLFLALAIIASFISLPVFAQEYSLSQEIQSVDYSGTTLSVTTKIFGNTDASATGYAAVYSSADEVKGVNSVSISADTANPVVYKIENYTYATGDYIKTFLWDENYAPLSNTVTESVDLGDVIEGIIVETYLSSTEYTEGDNTVSILVTDSSTDEYTEGEVYDFVSNNTSDSAYLGFSVVATVDSGALTTVTPKEGANTLITLDQDLINYIDDESISYYETNSSKHATEAGIQPYATISGEDFYFNNIVINGFNDGYELTDYFFDFVHELDQITLLDNDNDGAFEFIFASIPSSDSAEFMVKSIEYIDGLYAFNSAEDFSIEVDLSDKNIVVTVIKDGVVTTPDAICEGDIITCLDTSVPVMTVYASSVKIEGLVAEIDDDLHNINGTDYKISPLSGITDIDVGTSGVFYLNAFGKIAHIELPPLDYKFFYITAAAISEDSFNGTTYLVKGITQSGTEETYEIKNRNVDIYTPDGNATKVTAKTAYRYFEEYTGITKVVLDDNSKLTCAVFPDAADDFITDDRYKNDAEEQTKTYNDTRLIYGVTALSPDTVIFNVDTENGVITTSTVGEAFTDGASYSFVSYGTEGEIASVLVTFDIEIPEGDAEPILSESEYVFLIDYAQMTDAFNEECYYVQIMTNDSVVDPYLINDKNVSVYTEDGVTASLTNAETYSMVSSYVGVAKVAFTEDGKVAEFYLPGCDEFSKNTAYESTQAEYNEQTLTLGTTAIDKETVLYTIDSAEEDLDAALSAYSAYKVLKDGSSYSFTSYGKEGDAAGIILVYDLEIPSNAEETAMVITKVSDAIVNTQDAVKVTGVKDGATTSVYVSPLDYENLNLQAGNVIIYTLDNNYATDIQLLFTSTEDGAGSLTSNLNGILTDEFSDEYVTIHYGEITDKTSKTVTLDNSDKFYFGYEVNVIVVDYTGADVSIESGTLTSIRASNAKFKRTAFVKTIPDMEDEISDVIVFVTTA